MLRLWISSILPGLEDYWSHHAHKHDIEDGVVKLHVSLSSEDQHAWHCLHCNHCDRACIKDTSKLNTEQTVN